MDVVMMAAFGLGAKAGLKAGPIVDISRVKAGEETVWRGLTVVDRPVIGKTPEGWVRGWPKSETLFTEYYTPAIRATGILPGETASSLYQARLETEMFLRLAQTTPETALEAQDVLKSIAFSRAVAGTQVPAARIQEILRTPFERAGMYSEEQINEFLKLEKTFQKEGGIFGSAAKRAAQEAAPMKYPIGEYGEVGDIDRLLESLSSGERYVTGVQKIFGEGVTVETPELGTWKIASAEGGRLLDIHVKALDYGVPRYPWGLEISHEPTVKVEGFKVTPLGEEFKAMWSPMRFQEATTAAGERELMAWTSRPKDLFRGLQAGYTLSVATYGPETGATEFAPFEDWIKTKLIKMGFTEAEMAGMAAEVAKEPVLLRAPPSPSISYPTVSVAAIAPGVTYPS